MNEIKMRLQALRERMNADDIDVIYIPTADHHDTEFAGDYFAERRFFSGFTGSAGSLVVTAEEAGLFTDGRYYLQAERELAGSGIDLYKCGLDGVPTPSEFIEKVVPKGGCLGFDGRCVSGAASDRFKKNLGRKNARLCVDIDPAEGIWKDRPERSHEPAFVLDEQYAGRSATEKLAQVREKLADAKADELVLTTLDDIAWLFNIRGNDIPYAPLVYSYARITSDMAFFYADERAIGDKVREHLKNNGVQICGYEEIYEYYRGLKQAGGSGTATDGNAGDSRKVMLNRKRVNSLLVQLVSDVAVIVDEVEPTTFLKACKNETELKNLRSCHIKDGVCVTKFICWLKQNVSRGGITEMRAAEYIDGLRKQQEGCIELSFGTISAYNEDAAIIHYSPAEDHDAVIEPRGMLLVDSGGHYLEGTTDITRTIVLGEIPDEWKKYYTLVLKGNLALANARFLHGCTGRNLDILAREPLWRIGADFRHGTGHGVGYLMNVHEAPNGFRWRVVEERSDNGILEEGMVTSDEPGFYTDGEFGIRLENELVCRNFVKNDYGQFMEFETLTVAPFDLDAVDASLLTEEDIDRLNDYHKTVYETLAPFLTEEERAWLAHETRMIDKL